MLNPSGAQASREHPLSPEEFIARCEREHGVLKTIYTHLIIAYNKNFRRQTIEKILHIMGMYVKFHFDNEENFMCLHHYNDTIYHSDIHRQFIKDLSNIIKSFEDGDDVYDRLREIYYSLKDGHIPETDAELLKFAQQLGKTACPERKAQGLS
jgi:hemerythrin-like metal-binding protein